MEILGIDIGATGIKGAPVDVTRGVLTGEEHYLLTPQPSAPDAVADTVAELVRHFDWKGPIGCTFPSIIRHGVAYNAANVDDAWIGTNGEQLFTERTGCPLRLINDGDAAGVAEMELGAGRGHTGVVFVLAFGTGIGSAVFVNRQLLANTELGHIEMRGLEKDAEWWTSGWAKQREELSYEAWTERVNKYLNYLDYLFSVDLFILGGGISRDHDKFLHMLKVRSEVVPAHFYHQAGIVGAALAARELAENV
jgi:polyphosphate glucokinase